MMSDVSNKVVNDIKIEMHLFFCHWFSPPSIGWFPHAQLYYTRYRWKIKYTNNGNLIGKRFQVRPLEINPQGTGWILDIENLIS